MKITGPGSGAPPQPPGDTEAASGKAFAEKVAQRTGVAAGEAPRAGLTSEIGADLKAGRITAQAAVERVIDLVIDRQVGADAPPAVREKLGAALRQALEDDPLLAEKIRTLG